MPESNKALNMTQVTMSLRDVEPVKSFIANVVDIRNRLSQVNDPLANATLNDLDAAFKLLYNGMGRMPDRGRDAKIDRGWKVGVQDVPHPERETWPSVCIIIPVFNSPELLKRCLTSLMRTDYPGKVYWCAVDNASTDVETLAILANQEFTPLRFEQPVGFAEAVNAGIQACPGFDYYVLYNQDVSVVEERWLEYLINWMELRPECAIAGAKLLYPDGTIQHAGLIFPAGTTGAHRLRSQPAAVAEAGWYEKMMAVTGAVFAIKASILDQVGLFDEQYKFGCEDVDLCLRAAVEHGFETWYMPQAVLIHHEGAIRDDNDTDRSRVGQWVDMSDSLFRARWGKYLDFTDRKMIAIVVDDAALPPLVTLQLDAYLANAGQKVKIIDSVDDGLETGILIATSPSTVEMTKHISAERKFLWMDDLDLGKWQASLTCSEYELVTMNRDLASGISAEYGRSVRTIGGNPGRELVRMVFGI